MALTSVPKKFAGMKVMPDSLSFTVTPALRHPQHAGIEGLNRRAGEQAQGGVDVAAIQGQQLGHAGLTARRERPDIRPPDKDGTGAESDGFDHITASPDAAVEEYLDA